LRQARKDLWSKAEVTLDAGTVVVASLAIAPEADTTEVSCGDPIKVAKISSTGPEALLLQPFRHRNRAKSAAIPGSRRSPSN
jgi:hypothetical protein